MGRPVAPRARAARARARRRTAGAVVVGLVAAGLGYAAVASDGSTVHEADLNDAGVWVSSTTQAKFAKANVPVGQLDVGVATDRAAGSGLDVLQDGAVVLGLATGTGELFPLDARDAVAGDPVAAVAPVDDTGGRFAPRPVDLRGGTLALLDPRTGELRAQRVDPEAGTDSFPGIGPDAKPVAKVGKDATIAVGLDGVVHAVSGADGSVTTVAPLGQGFGPPVRVATGLRSAHPDITALGDRWVAYDPDTDRVFTADRTDGADAQVTVDGDRRAALQVPGPDADTVVVESAKRAALVPLDGGPPPGGVAVSEQVGRSPAATVVTRPVVMDGCLHAAWAERQRVFYGANCGRTGDEPTTTLPADGNEPTRDGVAFRVNRGLVVLNDLDNGGVWDLEDKPTRIDDWDALTPPVRQDDKNKKKDRNLVDEASAKQPPKAVPDQESVRPGLTSKLHVLDNDTAAPGSVLAIDQGDVSRPSMDGVTATVSADGQAVDVSVPAGSEGREFDFSYKVNDGSKTSQNTARVSVRIVPDSVNGPPRLRPGAAASRKTYPVIAGKRLSVPVLADWRDPENDVLAARADVDGSIVDGAGRVTLVAPTEVGRQRIPYVVTDGRGGTTKDTVDAQVIGTSADTRFVAPQTQPDAVRGVVGKPLEVEPLGNDIAGADPGEPDAVLALRSELRPVGPLQVDTDLATGQVTITGSTPGTYELSYAAVTGAGAAPGRIRVDLTAPPEGAPPVAVPDTATLHDQSPALVDVLANDYSPRGDVLVTAEVQDGDDASWVQPSIYQGRWVRLEATAPAPAGDDGRRGVVRYTVSDGTQRVTGEISVLQQGALTDALPVVVDDEATVREGDTVSVPVLDNDTMADGIPLRIDPASVKVISKGDAQRAFASGNVIRYVPEARGLTAAKFVTVEYAAYAEGARENARSARVRIQVNPLPSAAAPNQTPVARSFTATVTAGDPITMTVPTFNVDPDGDAVSVVGVVGADGGPVDLTLGRVTSVGPTSVTYESYPLAAGTEIITYEVTDRFGATSRASIRVGVVRPGDPQPPVAVDDEVFAAPGKTVTVHPLTNDLIARGDVVEVDTDSLNDAADRKGWSVDADHTVTTKVPAETTRLHQLVYGISDGLFDPSRASILVRPVKGFVNPPVANDDVAKPKPGEDATDVDVLANDTDVDSDPATLEVVDVLSSDATWDAASRRLRVKVLDHPYSVPYVIEDEDGARAMALVHVPTGANGQPFVVSGALVQMDPDSTKRVRLADYVRSPRDRVVSVTTASTLSASPANDLAVRLKDPRTLELTSSNGYVGPAAVMLEVTDQTAVDQKDVGTAYVSIPVQVGPKVPLLRCPDGAVTVTAGGLPRTVDIPTFCHAWLPVGMTFDDVTFDARWETEADADLTTEGDGGRRIVLTAGPQAKTSTGRIVVTPKGAPSSQAIAVRVLGGEQPQPKATLRPISVTGLEEGQTRTVDVADYLDSPLRDPRCSLTGANLESGSGLTTSVSGCVLTLKVGEKPSPRASVAITVSDGPNRETTGRVSVTMLGRPSAPRQVQAVADRDAGGQARVSWLPPEYDGGTSVTDYVVRATGGPADDTTCHASPCTVTGLTNGEHYRFTVAAVNAVGEGEESGATSAVTPDRLPERVTGVRMAGRGDHTLTVAWDEPVNEGSALNKYVVRVISSTGRTKTQDVPASSRRTTVSGLDNMAEQEVSVQAWNDLGAGPFGPAVTMQSAGTPPALKAPDIAASGPGPAQDSATLTVSWEQGSPNGPPTTGYTLYQRVGGNVTTVTRTAPDVRTAKVVIPYDGRTYEYAVTLTNGADIEGPRTNWSTFTSDGVPSTPTVQTTTPSDDQKISVTVGVGQPRSGGFAAIRWSGGGQSGTVDCTSCAAGSQKTFAVGPFPTSPTTSRTITVWTVNTGGNESQQVSDSAVPYGPTIAPTGMTGGNDGTTGAHWSWNLPENGRPIDQVQLQGAASGTFGGDKTSHSISKGPGTYTLQVRAHSLAGWSGWTSKTVVVPRPTPSIVNVHKGPNATDPNGIGSCRYSPGCPKVLFDIRDFPAGSTWDVRVWTRGGAGNVDSSRPLVVDGSGNGYSWSGYAIVANGNGPVAVRLCRAGGGACHTSDYVSW